MKSLTERYDERIAGVVSCYDRVVTGTLPGVCYAEGMTRFLYANRIRIFDDPQFAARLRDAVRVRAASVAMQAGIAIEHIAKSHLCKEEVVAKVLAHRGDRPGLVHIISAMRFMIKETGGVNADVFIEFLRRLLIGSKNRIFIIVDRGPAHVAKKTKAFVASLGGRLRLFFLPPYSPDKNPDELVWKHLKADIVGRTSITSFDDFKDKVRSSMLSLRRNPAKIRAFFQKPSLQYAA